MTTITREEWQNIYQGELEDMYDIMLKEIELNYSNLHIDIKETFHNFSRLIFHCSSKELTEYSKNSLNESDLINKHGKERTGHQDP